MAIAYSLCRNQLTQSPTTACSGGRAFARRAEVAWLAFGAAALGAVLAATSDPSVWELALGLSGDAAFAQGVVCAATAGAVVLLNYGARDLPRPGATQGWLLASAGAAVLLSGAASAVSAGPLSPTRRVTIFSAKSEPCSDFAKKTPAIKIEIEVTALVRGADR